MNRPLAAILAEPALTAEQKLWANTVMKPVVLLQNAPAEYALIVLSGVAVPPHERLMLAQANRGVPTNVNVSSRGTSKSSTWCVLFAAFQAITMANRKIVELSASGFRGGQLILNDLEKWSLSGWDDQEPVAAMVKASLSNPKIVHRAQNFWQVNWKSLSSIMTLPTNDPDKIRGVRAHSLFVDEANIADMELIEKVAVPFLNVKGGFRTGGQDAATNQMFYTATIDYSWRQFQKTKQSAYEAIQRDYDAARALAKGDRTTYDELVGKGLHTATYTSFDYTDTIIRRVITTRDGRKFKVNYPNPDLRWQDFPRGVPFTERGEDGTVGMVSGPCQGVTTYPLDIPMIEKGLYDGSAAESFWLAEQRNVTDTAAGDVYAHSLVDKASCVGDRYVLSYAECPESWQKFYFEREQDYAPTVQWSSTDPCVLGVDYAGGDRDFSAFVVIRLGPLAKPASDTMDFDPLTGLGKTPWSNVVWAEQWRLMSHDDVAKKIHALAERYNLVWFDSKGETDDWKVCRAIGMDMRGGGAGVRDQLVHINSETLAEGDYRIYDPLDPDPRVVAFHKDTTAKPMLDAIMPTDELNDRLVDFTSGQMQQGLLYLPQFRPESQREGEHKIDLGYAGARSLDSQLRKLQQAPTKRFRTFFMKGSKEAVENKKDIWAAFIYAAKQMRAHVIRQRMIDTQPPPMGLTRVQINTGRPGTRRGRTLGTKYG